MRRLAETRGACRWLGVAILLIASASSCWAGDRRPTKLAIVDVGSGQRVPVEFVDFLTLALGHEPQVALLERGQVEQILREQSLEMMLAGTNAVRAGKLVAADAFLMLELQTNQTVRVRLVDAHYGLKLWDTMFALNTSANDSEERAQALAKGTVFRLANFTCGTDTPRTVSISAFRSEEMSKRWDWLGETLAAGVEQQLALQPGIVVMERARTRPLIEERELTEGLPESLLASTVIVDGGFRIPHAEGKNVVTVTLRCRRNNADLFTMDVDGSLANLPELQGRCVQKIMAAMRGKSDCGSMDPVAEADMLATEASALMQDDPKRALHLAEAAASLVPGATRYQSLLIGAYSKWLGATPEEYLTYSLHGLDVMEGLVGSNREFTQEMYNFLGGVAGKVNWPLSGSYRSEMALPENRERFRELGDAFWRVTEEYRLAIPINDTNNSRPLLGRINEGFRFCHSTTDAIERSRRMQEAFIDSFHVYDSGPIDDSLERLVDIYFDPGPATWPSEKGAGTRLAGYLDELCQTNDVLVRMLAEEAEMVFYGTREWNTANKPVDYVKAQKHAEKYVDAVREARKLYSRLFEFYEARLGNTKFSDDLEEDKQFKHRMMAMLEPPPQLPSTNLVELAAHRIFGLSEAVKETLTDEWQTAKPQTGVDIHFRRLVIGTNCAAVVYTYGTISQERCGLLRLDARTLRPVDFIPSSIVLDFNSMRGNLPMGNSRLDPAAVECDGDIFVSFLVGGIIRFRKDNTTVTLNEANGLATENIMALESLDGKLYAVVGRRLEETGVMGVDPQSGDSKILFSTRTKFTRSELDGRPIEGIAADKNHHILWVLTPQGFFYYRPVDHFVVSRTDLAASILKTFQSPEVFGSLQRQGTNLLVGGNRACVQVNMGTEQVEVLAASIYYPWTNVRSRWTLGTETPTKIVVLSHGLAFIDKYISADWSGLLCLDNRSKPVDILNMCFPSKVASKLTVRDIAIGPSGGLLFLTDDSLYVIPELRDTTQEANTPKVGN